MWMSSNVRTLLVTRDEHNQLSVNEVDLADVSQFEQQEEVFLHPLLIAMSHSLVHGLDYSMDLEEEKNKLTEVEFKNLETCGDITNCAICMENKKPLKSLAVLCPYGSPPSLRARIDTH